MKRWQDKILREEGLLAATTLGEENQLEDNEVGIYQYIIYSAFIYIYIYIYNITIS